jgi:hypothetical protein
MALVREPEKSDTKIFQCRIELPLLRRWNTLDERATKLRVNLRKSFAEHFATWLDEVETELNSMNVKPIRNRAEE